MSRIVAVVMLAVVLLAGATAIDAGYQAAGERTDVDNETVTAEFNKVLTLSHSQQSEVFYDEEIRLYTNTTRLTGNGTDYDWYSSNGTLRVYNTTEVTKNETLYAYYGYNEPSENQQQAMDIAVALWDPAYVLIFVMGASVVLAALRLTNG